MTDGPARVVEALVQKWLLESDIGRPMLDDSGMSLDAATDAVFELLNAGFLKIVTDGDPSGVSFSYAIEPRNPPEMPAATLHRPKRRPA